MPELPEVETIRRCLEEHLLGKVLCAFSVRDPRAWSTEDFPISELRLPAELSALRRRGKYLVLDFSSAAANDGFSLLVHLRMTGKLLLRTPEEQARPKCGLHFLFAESADCARASAQRRAPAGVVAGSPGTVSPSAPAGMDLASLFLSCDKQAPLFWCDGRGTHSGSLAKVTAETDSFAPRRPFLFLDFHDTRRFGGIRLLSLRGEENNPSYGRLGPDALSDEYSEDYFLSCAARHPHLKAKAFLLNQEIVAGFGNIYADETLFLAGIHPARRIASLSVAERRLLYTCGRRLLTEAVGLHGCSFRDYVDSFGRQGQFQLQLQVYRRERQPCFRCGAPIQKTEIAGRGTRYCPHCQK